MLELALKRMKTLLTNCGGRNRRVNRYAGRLLESVTDDEFVAICHNLIFDNGTRKTTDRQRNLSIIQSQLERRISELTGPLSILDVGASIGLDALATIEWLQETSSIREYVLGDLYTHIIVDSERGLVFDQDQQLIQILSDNYFTATNFSFQYPIQKYISYLDYLRTSKNRNSWQGIVPSKSATLVALIHPELTKPELSEIVSLQRLDVFEHPPRQYDIVICFNLLVARYFSATKIAAGIESLSRALNPGGILIAGANDGGVVLQRSETGREIRECSSW